MKFASFIIFFFFITCSLAAQTDTTTYWHHKGRSMHYQPSGDDFICVNPHLRFNRALYGSNTAFRVEAGDLPEFALYMPGMGGNLKFGLISGNNSKWLINTKNIKARYRPGSMIYEIRDSLLQNGVIQVTALALYDKEGIIVKIEGKAVPSNVKLLAVFGGASGNKFSRDGDIGADPESSFYLKPEYCKGNIYQINKNTFTLQYGGVKARTEEERYEIQHLQGPQNEQIDVSAGDTFLYGIFPAMSQLKLGDASMLESPLSFFASSPDQSPAIGATISFPVKGALYFLVQNAVINSGDTQSLNNIFNQAEESRKQLASRIRVHTPDTYINTLGGALSMAADAIWEDPSYLHGAVAWRMRLNAWRGPYVADPLGWHDRARKHFSSYALSQVIDPPTGPVVADTALHLARQLEKLGTSLFSNGYISRNPNGDLRAHHYDMNLVFVDALLDHFNWTGDTAYVKQMWPLIQRHLAWEKRNFDADGDGLYDAYAAIWPSDALQYSGGGVTHSSAYNYRANKKAAELAKLIGEDGTPYKNEADKIYNAVQKNLWLPDKGWYAEYKDLLGNKLVHESPGLWTIYHAIDEKLADPFQAYQSLCYVDKMIPQIPVLAKGLKENDLYLLSSTNWQPYTWSLNNVGLAENLHTALAYWQGNRNEDAYRLWKSALIESMYMSSSPGGFEQLSFYDAIRGELYRDFADPIGMAGRSLVEGLFGIQPNALHDSLTIQPGFPASWKMASLRIPDIDFDFKSTGNKDVYIIQSYFQKELHLQLIVPAYKDAISAVIVNGQKIKWEVDSLAVGSPRLFINAPLAKKYAIEIQWKGNSVSSFPRSYAVLDGHRFQFNLPGKKIVGVYDPQQKMDSIAIRHNAITAIARDHLGPGTFFAIVKQGQFTWWQPVTINTGIDWNLEIRKMSFSNITIASAGKEATEQVDLSNLFNDKVTNIFKHQYLSPRPASPTLQLPTQGIGNWCYPLVTANIDDKGLRQLAGNNNQITTLEGLVFATPSDSSLNNIIFTSQWDNFPHAVNIPLSGKASGISLLMAGSTNAMQSRITNGIVVINYTDGTGDTLLLKNPENWLPIEQDYYVDGYAFKTGGEKPQRLYLKYGKFANRLTSYSSIKGFTNMAIDGGAATVLEMYLDEKKTLKSMTVEAIANDVVIGLMAATLIR